MTVPLDLPPGRDGFGPALALTYSSSSGEGLFGLGWDLGAVGIRLRTERGVPRYDSADEVLYGGKVLVHERDQVGVPVSSDRIVSHTTYRVEQFRPWVETDRARVERWTAVADASDVRWRVITAANVTTWYGDDADSRIFDPADPRHIVEWLPRVSYDDRGNLIRYRYRHEDSTGVDLGSACEAGRTARQRTANRYLSRMSWANRTPYLPTLTETGPTTSEPDDHCFHLVLDYGDHDDAHPGLDPTSDWTVRPDPFSTHRPGFEVRTYRRCRRILRFHSFPELGTEPVLVSRTDLTYADAEPRAVSLLASVTHTGIGEDGDTLALPALELGYAPWRVGQPESVEHEQVVGAPVGFDGVLYEWVDLDGDGAPGILARRDNSWYYKQNLGPLSVVQPGAPRARFGVPRIVTDAPTGLPRRDDAAPDRPGAVLADVDGDGRTDLLVLDASGPGVALRSGTSWTGFRTLGSAPAGIRPRNPAWSLADLTGDGLVDLLVAEGDSARWHPALGAQGFGPARPARLEMDAAAPNDSIPLVIRTDPDRLVALADLDGDGLVDLVEVTRTGIRYRPSLGHGRFGPLVRMDGAPVLDGVDAFDARHVLLADVDGTGPSDLVYLGGNRPRLYRNLSGNGWAEAVELAGAPGADAMTRAAVIDLFGRGTGALVWSTMAPRPDGLPMHYVDLAAAGKPHLLTSTVNGFGRRTVLEYTPSSTFALRDALEGAPWPTRLPFPVHCLSRITVTDDVRGTTCTSTRSYHMGRYDGFEREFMGFGRIDTRDAEQHVDVAVDLPPVLGRCWYHTGAALADAQAVLHSAREQYADLRAPVPPEPDLPDGLDADGSRHAARALAGVELRSEVYAEDGGPLADEPYAVHETVVAVHLVQAAAGADRPAFRLLPVGEMSYATERDPDDPRVTQSLVLATDELGLVTSSASIVHPRRLVDAQVPAAVRAAQSRLTVVLHRQDRTDDVTGEDVHRVRQEFRSTAHELTGLTVPAGTTALAEDVRQAVAQTVGLGPDETPDPGVVAARLLGRRETRFLADDLASELPPGAQASHGLPSRMFTLSMTADMVATRFGADVDDQDLAGAGFVHLDGDDAWWVPSGRWDYPPDAAQHFLQPTSARDAMDHVTGVERLHDLLVVATENGRGHRVDVEYDLRRLQPQLLTDPNGNRSAVRFDPLGVVVAAAVLGKPGASGDTLDDPTVRLEYDLQRWATQRLPATARVLAREQHGGANPRWQESRLYFDGAGSLLAVKAQASPGLAQHWDEDTATLSEVDTTPEPRWVSTGRTVLNNKGLPIRQFEPYFSDAPDFDSAAALVEAGVSDLVHYDPLGRPERVDRPDGTFEQVDVGPWQITRHDAVDTVLDSQWYVERGSPDPAAVEPADLAERAAWVAARNAATPTVTHLDVLGRRVARQADNGAGDLRLVRSETDVGRTRRRLFDARDRLVADELNDLAGLASWSETAERGRAVSLDDVLGGARVRVDATGRRFVVAYDDLHRPVRSRTTESAATTLLTTRVSYGDDRPGAAARNAVGRPVQVYDESGRVDIAGFDLDGAPTSVSRRFVSAAPGTPDWTAVDGAADPDQAAEALLDDEVWTTSSTHDALGRPETVTLPDGSVLALGFDVGNRLVALTAQTPDGGPATQLLTGQEHDAHGRPTLLRLGNGLSTSYTYDERSRRMTTLRTAPTAGAAVQQLSFEQDPLGNVTSVRDDAQQTAFFDNAVVTPLRTFTYDALSQLVRATGRELGALIMPAGPDALASPLPHPNDTQAVRRYAEEYSYDDLGNLTEMRHVVNGAGWRRRFRYAYQLDAADRTNRLDATSAVGDPDGVFSQQLGYDPMGNLIALPQVRGLTWDPLGRLSAADLGGGGTARYWYGVGGGRIRKVVDRGGLVVETLYLGGVEIRRERVNGALRKEVRTVLAVGEAGRIARLDRLTVDGGVPVTGAPVIRWLHSDHLGSVSLTTDDQGRPVGYEEYHPFGTTAYRSAAAREDVSLARYRFLGRERDDETGFYHLGARPYLPWLGRFASPDPAGFVDGLNLYRYSRNNPMTFADPGGTKPSGFDWVAESKQEFTGKETFADLQALAKDVPGYEWDPAVTAENYQSRWVPGHGWAVLRPVLPSDVSVWEPEAGEEVIGTGGSGANEADAVGVGESGKTRDTTTATGAAGDTALGQAPGGKDAGASSSTGGTGDKDTAGTGPPPTEEAPARTGGGGAVSWWDSKVRGDYVDANRVRSDKALAEISQAAQEGDAAQAMNSAEIVSEERAAARIASQNKLSPGGRALSQSIDTGQDFAASAAKYAERLPSVEGGARVAAESEFELARRIAVGAGETRGSIKALAKVGRVAGPVALAVGVGLGIWAIAEAPEGQRGRVASREAGSFVGGALGASVGMSAGVAAAGFLSGLLIGLGIVSGPIGWLAIGLGMLGGALVGWWWSKRGGQIGEAVYDAVD